MLLVEMDLGEIVEGTSIASTDAPLLATHKKSIAKVKRILMDLVKDHLICHIVGKSVNNIYAALITLY